MAGDGRSHAARRPRRLGCRPPCRAHRAERVIFGYLGHLLLTGWFEGRFGSIVLSVVAFLLWAPMLFGALPIQSGVSWENHLFGLLSGAVTAWVVARRWRRRGRVV